MITITSVSRLKRDYSRILVEALTGLTCSWEWSKLSLTPKGYHSKTNNQIKDTYIVFYVCFKFFRSFFFSLLFFYFFTHSPKGITAKLKWPFLWFSPAHPINETMSTYPCSLHTSVCSEWSSWTDSKNFDFRLRAWAVDMFPKFVSCCLDAKIYKCMINCLYDVFFFTFGQCPVLVKQITTSFFKIIQKALVSHLIQRGP